MPETKNINLLPGISMEQVQRIVKKEKINLSGLLFIFLIVFFSAIILGLNLWANLDRNNQRQKLADTEGQIRGLSYTETHQQTFNNKLGTYSAVTDHDYNADQVLIYLKDGASGLATINRLYLDSNLSFEISGTSSSFSNVARLWHDMSRDEEYFESISLENVSKNTLEEGSNSVSFSFKGKMVAENVAKLSNELANAE